MSSFCLSIQQDAAVISKKLRLAKIRRTDNTYADWEYFGTLLQDCRKKQIDEMLDPKGIHQEFVKRIQSDFKLINHRRSHKYFLLYKCIEEIFLAFPITVTNKSPDIPSDNFLGHTISQIKGTNYSLKLDPFLAWLWRDHEDEAKKLYDLLGLEQYRTYDHQEIQDYINNPPPVDKVEETQDSSASVTIPVHPQPQPIHIAPVAQKRPPIRFEYKGIREDDDNPFHPENMPFFGRKDELKRLDDFINCKHDIALWAVSGSSGTGKTRLVQHWMQHSDAMPADQWEQLMLGTMFGPVHAHKPKFWTGGATTTDKAWKPVYPTIIVIDYLHVYQAALDAIIKQCLFLKSMGDLKDNPIRILLIDHVFPESLAQFAGNPRYGMKDFRESDFFDVIHIFDLPLKLDIKSSFVDKDGHIQASDEELDRIMPLILNEGLGALDRLPFYGQSLYKGGNVKRGISDVSKAEALHGRI